MFEETNAVKDTVAAPATDTTVQSQTSTAASQNTEPEIKEGQAVPYERFKKINEERKTAETRLAERDREFETHKAGIELSKAAMADPTFAAEVNKIINAKNEGKLTAAEAKVALETAQDKADVRAERTPDPEVQEIKRNLQEQTVSRYVDRYRSLAKDAGYEDETDLKLLEDITTKYLLTKNKDAAKRYVQADIDEAFNKAHQDMEGYAKRRTASYVKDKVAEQPPTSKPGVAGSASKEFDTRGESVRFIAQGLKARKGTSEQR